MSDPIELRFDRQEWELLLYAVELYRIKLQHDPHHKRLSDSPARAARADAVAAQIFRACESADVFGGR